MIGIIHYPDLLFPMWFLLVGVASGWAILGIAMMIFVHKKNYSDWVGLYSVGLVLIGFISAMISSGWVASEESKVRDAYMAEKGYSNVEVDSDKWTASDADGKYVVRDFVRERDTTIVYLRESK